MPLRSAASRRIRLPRLRRTGAHGRTCIRPARGRPLLPGCLPLLLRIPLRWIVQAGHALCHPGSRGVAARSCPAGRQGVTTRRPASRTVGRCRPAICLGVCPGRVRPLLASRPPRRRSGRRQVVRPSLPCRLVRWLPGRPAALARRVMPPGRTAHAWMARGRTARVRTAPGRTVCAPAPWCGRTREAVPTPGTTRALLPGQRPGPNRVPAGRPGLRHPLGPETCQGSRLTAGPLARRRTAIRPVTAPGHDQLRCKPRRRLPPPARPHRRFPASARPRTGRHHRPRRHGQGKPRRRSGRGRRVSRLTRRIRQQATESGGELSLHLPGPGIRRIRSRATRNGGHSRAARNGGHSCMRPTALSHRRAHSRSLPARSVYEGHRPPGSEKAQRTTRARCLSFFPGRTPRLMPWRAHPGRPRRLRAMRWTRPGRLPGQNSLPGQDSLPGQERLPAARLVLQVRVLAVRTPNNAAPPGRMPKPRSWPPGRS